jgi:hypothetical protein
MQTKEYRTIDRAAMGWGNGPWTDEPDKKQWQDITTGLPCRAVRNHFGAWCGYVGVAPNHPYYGLRYREVDDLVDVHGGLTFSDFCEPDASAESGICHVPGPREEAHIYWFGFDLAHFQDLTPRDVQLERDRPVLLADGVEWRTYKPLSYVEQECQRLARALAAIAP